MKAATASPGRLWLTAARWLALMAATASLSLFLQANAIPAAFLLGGLVCAIVFSVSNQSPQLPSVLSVVAQGAIGATIANAIPIAVFAQLAAHWPLFTLGTCSVLLLSNGVGLLLARFNVLPSSTAIWGTSPGAAAATILMAENYGADVRLVALMQYLRVVMVALAAVLVTHFSIQDPAAMPLPSHHAISWHVADVSGFLQTLALIAASILVGRILRLPAAPLLVTLAFGLLVIKTGLFHITLPQPLLLLSYAVVGWGIGFRFTLPVLRHAVKILPRMVLSIALVVAACALMSQALVAVMDIDPLTAYLAMSPGGADSVAIIAASGHADMSFVMAMQTGRLILAIFLGPPLARWLAARQWNTASSPRPAQ